MSISLDHIELSLRSLAVPIAQITSDPENARQHSARNLEIIKTSLATFGQQKPIVIDAKSVCIAGNGTLAAATSLGWTHIAATSTRLNGLDARAFAIADNRATDTSEWHERVLAEQLAQLQNADEASHTAAGFTDGEIERWITDTFDLEAAAIPPEVPIVDAWHVLIACNDDADQRNLYERLTKDGYRCRLLTL